MLRLFVGIPMPESVAERLCGLASGLPGARWVPPENYHLTLRYLGEVDEGTAHDVDEALDLVTGPAFPLTLSGLGSFGKGHKQHALWAGVAESYQSPLIVTDQGRFSVPSTPGGGIRRLGSRRTSAGPPVGGLQSPKGQTFGGLVSDPLLHLQARIESALVRSGQAAEERKFSPHVTLAYLKETPEAKLATYMGANGLFQAGPFTVDRYCLYDSALGRSGSTYHILQEYPLGGWPP